MIDQDKYSKLYKAMGELPQALSEVKQSNPKAAKTIAKHLYCDTMCPWVGNRFAYNDFLSRHKNDGIHLSLDMNSFSSINDTYGHGSGDEAIKQFCKLASEISRSMGGKFFRRSGDEFSSFFPTPDRAVAFAGELKNRLSSASKIHDHQMSVSIGIGYNPEHAEKALLKAKAQILPRNPGNEPTSVVSLLSEPVPTNWRPAVLIQTPAEKDPSVLKLSHPLK